ncbi:MAG: type II toxin-antitoxin system PemK/MazF family toxin [Solirubrobacterales bacterium]
MPPRRGELYMTDPGSTVGHEQSGRRPFLVLSIEQMNRSQLQLVLAMPLTTTDWGSRLHVRIDPDESGLPEVSYAMPEMTRSISALRFGLRVGRVPMDTVQIAARKARLLLGLGRTRF